MSDKITYILEVLDKYSINTKKFKSEMLGVKKVAEALDSTLTKGFSFNTNLSKTIRETNALASSIDKVARANKKNANIAINTTRSLGNMRKTLAGAYTPIRFNPELGKYEPHQQYQPQSQPSMARGGGGMGISFGGVAKAMGYYSVIDKIAQTPKMIHDVAIEMDGLRAGLGAMIPKVKGLENVTTESEIGYLMETANKYGFRFNDIKDSYLKMLGTGAKASTVKGITENFGALGGLLNLEPDKQKFVLLALQDMLSKKTIQAQELHLQMAALPGGRELFYQAFYNLAQKHGMKDVTKKNYSVKFEEYAAQGRIPSEIVIEEVNKIIKETFGEDFKKKAHTLGKEENRLSNSFYELGMTISERVKPAMMDLAIAGTETVNSINLWTKDLFTVLDFLTDLGKKDYSKYRRSFTGDIKSAGDFLKEMFVGSGFEKEELKGDILPRFSIPFQRQISSIPNGEIPLQEQKIVIEFLNAPNNMSPIRIPANMSVRKDGTLSPAGGAY